MRKLLEFKLAFLAKLFLWRFHPKIVAITGSVGKTSTKEACLSVLQTKFRVRQSQGNYNNELGMPLTIIGAESAGRNLLVWTGILIKGFIKLFYQSDYPQVLVLELGVDHPGNMEYLTRILGRIDVAVITDIGISHLEFFPDQSALAREKLNLIRRLPSDSSAILNFDSPKVYEGRNQTKAKVFGYGFGDETEIRATDFHLIESEGCQGANFKAHYKGNVMPFFLPNSLGQPGVYAALAALGVGLHFGINLVEASEALKSYKPPLGRQRFIAGVNNTSIIDDTYNAAPASTIMAIDTLNNIAKARKVIAIGSMAELGAQSDAGHKAVAAKIVESAISLVFLVGEEAKTIREELLRRKFNGRVEWFPNSDLAKTRVKKNILTGDAILVKGSQSARMEKIVKEIMAEPSRASELLVRQSPKWLS